MLTNIQIQCQTSFTKTGVRNMKNRKPYRTAKQRAEARKGASVIDGRFVSYTPVSYHK